MADDEGGLGVSFSGVIGGSVTTDSQGNFEFYTDASSLGQADGTVTDAWGQVSNSSATVSSSTPALSFCATPTGSGRRVQVSGHVEDDEHGLGVSFSGVIGGSITVDAQGNFAFETDASALGEVTGSVTDAWGQVGNSSTTVSSSTPSLSFSATPTGNGRQVHVTGQVTDDEGGLGVSFSGVFSNSITVDAQGNFAFDIDASSLGQVSGSVTDAWGQNGTSSATVDETAPTVTIAICQTGNGREICVTGSVDGRGMAGRSISLSGVASGTGTINADGTYSITVIASSLGQVSASVTNAWDQAGSASGDIYNEAPQVTSVNVGYSSNDVFFDGTVQDEAALSAVVNYEYFATGSTSVINQNEFYLVTPQGVPGIHVIVFTVVDVWGVSSDPFEVYFDI
ncbi:MAG: hypothetical protein JNM18_24005 [Planctomycetaceae bacterium]|nr:hypothetical protein [Planctomycetaceae bacterium]